MRPVRGFCIRQKPPGHGGRGTAQHPRRNHQLVVFPEEVHAPSWRQQAGDCAAGDAERFRAAMSGALCRDAKARLTGGIKEANSGARELSAGKARLCRHHSRRKTQDDTLVTRYSINKDGVKITPDNSLKMLVNYALVA